MLIRSHVLAQSTLVVPQSHDNEFMNTSQLWHRRDRMCIVQLVPTGVVVVTCMMCVQKSNVHAWGMELQALVPAMILGH